MKIKRHVIRLTEEPQTVLMPAHARLLTARIEGKDLCLYTCQSSVQPDLARTVRVLATDTEFDWMPWGYIGTVMHKGTTYHVFESPV